MKRQERVYQALVNQWQDATQEQLLKRQGSSAAEIADQIGITRANSSAELNQLVKQGEVVKVKTYPVRFVAAKTLQQVNLTVPEGLITADLSATTKTDTSPVTSGDPFDQIIGSHQSLRKAVKQAKAAIMYPPTGLDMLLLGPTGAGKTLFANVCYQYAKHRETIPEEAPFISFNCADYYNNSQLLLSQLFGYVRGAYTGADKDKAGIVEKADGGVLLLDEVHRLPPEGQEMLFTFMDTGTFSRLGESGRSRHASVLIIAATNEDPKSNLLETFLRRIPTVIQIPSLAEKGLREQIEIINYLFRSEAARIRRDLDVSIGVVEALLLTDNYGNIGQLKSQIQLICARAFLNSLDDDGDVLVTTSTLPDELQRTSKTDANRLREITTLVPQHTIYSFNANLPTHAAEANIYHNIAIQVEQLKSSGLSDNEIQLSVMKELRRHVRDFLHEPAETVKLKNFISPKVLALTEKLRAIAEQTLNEKFDQRFLYYIGMHVDTYLNKHERSTHILMQDEIEQIKRDYQPEYHVAQLFEQEIFREEGFRMPDVEVIYLCLLISSLRQMPNKQDAKVGILVVAHGNSTATSLVDVATDLLGATNIDALDMPLNVAPTDMLERMTTKITHLDQGRGVLLLVDMGSLVHLQAQIEKRTSISTQVVPYVTTLVVLDTVRKANYLDMDLVGLTNSIKNDFLETLTSSLRVTESRLPKAILSICMTGSGTAERLKTIIVNIVNETTSDPIAVKTVSALQLANEIPKLKRQYTIIATVGTKKTTLKVPYVSLDSLIAGNGETVLRSTISDHAATARVNQPAPHSAVTSDICLDVLKSSLIYLNPYLLTETLIKWIKDLGVQLNVTFSNSMIVKCVVHTSFAFERSLTKETVQYPHALTPTLQPIFTAIKKTLAPYEKQLKVTIPDDELDFISEIVAEESAIAQQ